MSSCNNYLLFTVNCAYLYEGHVLSKNNSAFVL